MDNYFSDETRELIKRSRIVALELGYDYISTIHFFLADCSLNGKYSIKRFVFNTEDEFQSFYASQKTGPPSIFGDRIDDSLSLTKEAEMTIKKSLKEKKKYGDKKIEPYHIFLAASQLNTSLFASILTPREGLHLRLEEYYKKAGYISEKPKRSFFKIITGKIAN